VTSTTSPSQKSKTSPEIAQEMQLYAEHILALRPKTSSVISNSMQTYAEEILNIAKILRGEKTA